MAYLELIDIEKKYGDFSLSLSLSADEGEFVSLIGPSGSGKSTLLSLIAGLEMPDSGRIMLAGEDITGKRIQERNIGMVFQDFTLFPSMDVGRNIQFGMKERNRKKRRDLEEKLLALVGLEGYGRRDVTSLSGGEAQRVQLARAIASEPSVLLLDEPLSALDAPMRKHLRAVIRSIHDSLGITMIYVTHDTEEAFAISDTIAIIHEGTTAGKKTAESLYRNPDSLFTAFFTGEGTAIPASAVLGEGVEGTLFFRPENVSLTEQPLDPDEYPNHIIFNGAEIISAEFTGEAYMLGLDWQGCQILARTTVKPRRRKASAMVLKAAALML